MANGYIGQVHIGQDNYKIGSTLFAILDTSLSTPIGSITTSGSTKAYVVPLEGYTSTQGATVHIKFVQANTDGDKTLTLKVGNDSVRTILNPNGAKTWGAGSVISFTCDGTNWIMNSTQIDASTIDTSQLTGLSLGYISSTGTLQDNDVTIANGDKLVITDYSDSNKIVRSSLAFSDTVSAQTQSTTFLRSDGTWAAPTYTSITPGNGLINGTSGDSQSPITGSGTISIKASGVTNDMLAGSITPAKLDNTATIGIGTQSIKVGSSFDTATLLTDLGLSAPLRFIGITTVDMAVNNNTHDDTVHTYTGVPTITNVSSYTPAQGDVVINSTYNDEWVCITANGNSSVWERLGSDSAYKIVQTAVSDPSVPSSGTTTSNSFIATITQNSQGVITVTKRKVPVTSVAGKTGAITLGRSDVGLDNVVNLAQVTAVTWDSTNNKLQQTVGGETTTDIVTINTIKTALALGPSDVSLGSVSNNATLNGETGTTGDLIYWSNTDVPARLSVGSSTNGQVLTLVSGVPAWADNSATDQLLALTEANTTGSTATTYNLIFAKNENNMADAKTRLYNNGLTYSCLYHSTTSSEGTAILIVGNSTAKASARDLTGAIRLYGNSTGHTTIKGANVTSSNNQTLTLPTVTGGNLVGTSTTSAVGSDTTPIYIAANGVATAFGYTIAKPTVGSILYGSSTSAYSNLAAGTANQILMMGSSTPAWATIGTTNVYSSYTALEELTETVSGETITVINTNEISHVHNGILYIANSLNFGTSSVINSITIPSN